MRAVIISSPDKPWYEKIASQSFASAWELYRCEPQEIQNVLQRGDLLFMDVDCLDQIQDKSKLDKAIFLTQSNDPKDFIEILSRYGEIHRLASCRSSLPPISLAPVDGLKDRQQYTITNYSQKKKIIQDLFDYLANAKAFKDLPDRACTVASELMMNAIFDAPIDMQTGQAKYARLSRNEVFTLNESEHIEMNYGFDGQVFVISVKDFFGSLSRDKIVSNLQRCARAGEDQVRQGTGGAGVGLYLLIYLCSQLDIYVEPGRSTEVVARIFAGKRQKEYENQEKILNIITSTGSLS